MTLNDFESLSHRKQVEKLYRSGVYIGKLKKEGYPTVLFQLDSFYVEVSYKRYRHSIKALRCFDATDELDPYIEGMAIESLVYP